MTKSNKPVQSELRDLLKKYDLCVCGRHKDSSNFAYHICIEHGLRYDIEKLLQAQQLEHERELVEARIDELQRQFRLEDIEDGWASKRIVELEATLTTKSKGEKEDE